MTFPHDVDHCSVSCRMRQFTYEMLFHVGGSFLGMLTKDVPQLQLLPQATPQWLEELQHNRGDFEPIALPIGSRANGHFR